MPEHVTPVGGEAAAGPLAGHRVLDLSGALGAYCGKVLADLGADVLKLEQPCGDEMRHAPPLRAVPDGTEASLAFAYYHHNKRGLTLDWRRQDSLGLLGELAGTADVVLASPSTVEETPVGYSEDPPALSWVPEGVLTCFLSPFGLTGPYRGWRATHFTLFAMSGWMYPQGPVEGPPLAMPGQPLFDESGLWAAALVQAALLGSGPRRTDVIDHSAHEVALFHQLGQSPYTLAGEVKTRATNFSAPPSGVWRCRDGSVELAVHSPRQWEQFLEVTGRPPVLCDHLYRDRRMRVLLHDLLTELITGLMAQREVVEFVSAAQAAGLPCSKVQGPAEFAADPQADARGFFVTTDPAGTGPVVMPGAPFRSDPQLVRHRCSAPGLGEANREIYMGELGHSSVELQSWGDDGLL
jgi:crotonobetainyl-CoA:carnitine CoA-transferase CaiB-like acyl-CoA transferase